MKKDTIIIWLVRIYCRQIKIVIAFLILLLPSLEVGKCDI